MRETKLFARLYHLSLAMLSLVAALVLSSAGVAREAMAAESLAASLLAEFGFDAEERREVDAGEIVAIDGQTVLNNELTGAAAMRLPIPPAEVASRLRQGLVILADRQRLAYTRIDAAQADPWSAVRLEKDDAEVARLFDVGPGDTFNFSSTEIAAIRRTLAGRGLQAADGPATLAAAAWRGVLVSR